MHNLFFAVQKLELILEPILTLEIINLCFDLFFYLYFVEIHPISDSLSIAALFIPISQMLKYTFGNFISDTFVCMLATRFMLFVSFKHLVFDFSTAIIGINHNLVCPQK